MEENCYRMSIFKRNFVHVVKISNLFLVPFNYRRAEGKKTKEFRCHFDVAITKLKLR